MGNIMSENTETKDISAIDKALAGAKARSEAKKAKEPKAPKEKKVKETDEIAKARQLAEKAAKQAERAVKRAEKKLEQEAQKDAKTAARAAKKAERLAERVAKRPSHLSKVEKAAAKLPVLGERATDTFKRATKNLTGVELTALAQHLQHFVREQSTVSASGVKLVVGQVVRITSGSPKFVGQIATVNKVQRIRCYVDVPGVVKPMYLFTSDVEPVAVSEAESLPSDTSEATGTEG
jgi:hypothetical protein